MKILFVCRGNVGRSQMAESLFKKYVPGNHEVLSCGTKLSGPEQPIGELIPSTNNVLAVMSEEGVDVADNIRNQLTPEMVEWADRVIMITDKHDSVPDYLAGSPNLTHWELPDPKGTDLETHRKIKDEIKGLILEERF